MDDRPNILLIMTDEERYPPPYEGEDLRSFRRTQLTARASLQDRGLSFHRHYAGSTACSASRATLFTGQYPSLHGVTSTDGIAKTTHEVTWLDPDQVPTMGDWFRVGRLRLPLPRQVAHHPRRPPHVRRAGRPHDRRHDRQTHPGEHRGLSAGGSPRAVRVLSGWIGREPHGILPQDMGLVRDGVYAEQVTTMFSELAASRKDNGPWLSVASFVNPHDILFQGMMWSQMLHLQEPDDTVPDIAAAPSQADDFAGRPPCHEDFTSVWPQMTYPQEADLAYRRLYYYLHKVVDQAIGRILQGLTTRAWPTTPSSCSRPTTATSSALTVACSRSGTTPTTSPSGCRSWSLVRASTRRRRDHPSDQPCRPRTHDARSGRGGRRESLG